MKLILGWAAIGVSAVGVMGIAGCASSPVPNAKVASSEAAIRAPQETGSRSVPQAALQPRATAQPESGLVEVDYPPLPARVELIEAQPSDDGVWINGERFRPGGRKWSWRPGISVVPPGGAGYARQLLVRRSDGKLFFAPATGRDATGAEVPAPPEKVTRSRSALSSIQTAKPNRRERMFDRMPAPGAMAPAP